LLNRPWRAVPRQRRNQRCGPPQLIEQPPRLIVLAQEAIDKLGLLVRQLTIEISRKPLS
jgi:hypothetical protein